MADEFTPFDLARLGALKEYAALEFELFKLFDVLTNADAEVASAVFYRIVAARTRYAIIGDLLDIRHPKTFKRSWNRLEHWLLPCDTARNHIIHWSETHFTVIRATLGSDETPEVERVPQLRNSARVGRSESWTGEKFYSEAEIRAERDNFRVAKHIANRFTLCVREPEQWPWTDIFQQPIARQKPVEFLRLLNERGIPAQLPPYDQ